jgi:hypothetical protein
VKNANITIPQELIECMSSGSFPSTTQIAGLGERIWRDTAQHRSAFSWADLAPDACERVLALRTATLVLNGND